MTDKPARPALKNIASAPVIYFDAAPALGQSNGVVSIVLSAMLLSPQTDAQVVADLGSEVEIVSGNWGRRVARAVVSRRGLAFVRT